MNLTLQANCMQICIDDQEQSKEVDKENQHVQKNVRLRKPPEKFNDYIVYNAECETSTDPLTYED